MHTKQKLQAFALVYVAGQKLPRVVATPQALITKDDVARYQGGGVDVRAVLMEDAAKDK